ncbi:MAG TPA: ThuA domain-containing protein [Flavobacteriales bacterium]|nr:ThuA domain-containing protein [Flavobacteriales bacterium]
MHLLSLAAVLASTTLLAQPRVLHFTRTSGYDHGTREASNTMFQDIGAEINTLIDDDQSATPFSDPAVLAQYVVIVFSNTSGNAILDAQQRSNFEQWVANGGHVLGIHAASDTYRHSTANGNNTGSWDFYAELIGASVQENPNHVAGTPAYSMQQISPHASTANLPDPWLKNEEYYYWEGGYYGPDNWEVLRVEETVGPNGQVNSYDAARPMSWYRILPNGTRVFYTALGHAQSNYTSDMLFRTHIKYALAWLLGGPQVILGPDRPRMLRAFPNPASEHLVLHGASRIGAWAIHDAFGRQALSGFSGDRTAPLSVASLASGIYDLRSSCGSARIVIAH